MPLRTERELQHWDEYDPNKAHEYYLERRELKGRKKGSGSVSPKGQRKGQQQQVVTLRASAKASRERIEKKLEALLKKLKAQAENVEINVIPENAPPKRRAFLEEMNRNIRAEAAKSSAKDSKAARESARSELRKVGSDLKAAVDEARTTYKTKMDALKAGNG